MGAFPIGLDAADFAKMLTSSRARRMRDLMTAHTVLVRWNCDSMMNVGMTSAVRGTITEPSRSAKVNSRPLNANFANP